MGVMSCRRNNCNNIMCDRYSYRYGYICNECFEELLHSNLNIRNFMETSKPEEYDYNRFEMLDKEFPKQFNEQEEK
jgi:hypothetical protein